MTNDKKPGVAFWATVGLVVVLVGYPLSFGPACWWFHTGKPANMPFGNKELRWAPAPSVYWPLGWLAARGPQPVQDAIKWYARRTEVVMLPFDSQGSAWHSSK